MTTEYFMTGFFTHVDNQFNEQGINGKHPQAKLYVSESPSAYSLPSKEEGIEPSIAG